MRLFFLGPFHENEIAEGEKRFPAKAERNAGIAIGKQRVRVGKSVQVLS